MTAQPAVESVVTVERFDNVVQLTWVGAPPRPPVTHEPLVVGGRGKRLPTTSLRHLRRCWRRSQLRRDLIDCGWLMGLIAGGLICVVYRDELQQLAHFLFGGTR